jgi:D-alanyl-D-alanine-carboxypeptidase/D-alanyl-D-alanine-endopeptidase
MNTAIRVICFTLLLSAFPFCATGEDFTNAIHAYLQQRVEAEKINIGIVVGLVDEKGSTIVGCGKLDNGTDQEVNGDTVFEIGSVTKTFTGLLLQNMVDHGEMKLDDPVAKYLPNSIKMPTRNGKEITLLQLATHTSGLPREPDNCEPDHYDPRYVDAPDADYTVEKLYAFLSGYRLARDPGAQYEYSNPGMTLVGQAAALKAGTNYEGLVVDRICRPLQMNSTRITLTPELKTRFAIGHSHSGYVLPSCDFGAFAPVSAMKSTANDMLKYLAANLGLTPSTLMPAMKKAHAVHFLNAMPATDIGLAWVISRDPQGTKIVWHNGATYGHLAFAGFDKARRRGVVLLSNSRVSNEILALGSFLLKSEWQADRRPGKADIGGVVYGSYVGQYRRSGTRAAGASSEPGIGIRREADRLFARVTGSSSWPVNVLLPPVSGELMPESETRFFERVSGTPMSFSRDAQGKVTGLTLSRHGEAFAYEKTSGEQPNAPEPPGRPIAIKLDPKLLDACTGHYEFAPDAALPPPGMKLRIWRDGEHLIGQLSARDATHGPLSIYAESETNFFLKIDGAQLTFTKNHEKEVTAVILHAAGLPDIKGKKVKN